MRIWVSRINKVTSLDPSLRWDDGSKVESASISTVVPAEVGTQRLSISKGHA
jgi:hypothetical protein